ncbi:hypothetical protein OIU76_019081 [Salix suchowensis]|nr:hypothetical protein OIU76_019081 [Salix suchowensis]
MVGVENQLAMACSENQLEMACSENQLEMASSENQLSHQKLVKGFLRSAYDMLAKNGEAHVTHKTAHPFDRWEIEKLAEDAGLCLIAKSEFFTWDYPGYCNKRGDGDRAGDSFPVGDCCTFKFRRSKD